MDGSPVNARRTHTSEHRQTRRDAERRRTSAQREITQLRHDARHELRTVRRSAETATVVGRTRLAELAAQGLTGLAARLHTNR